MFKKILLVEDDKFLGSIISKKLRSENYEVIEALNGEDGVVKAEESRPDLVLLDLILPGIDGFEVLAKIRKNPVMDKIPVIILSNLSQREEVEKALNLGAIDFIIKAHFTPGEIIEKIKKILK